MPRIITKCECGNSLMATVSDNIYNEKLVWHMSYRCKKCGAVIEMDDTDYMPDEIRQAIINEEGEYCIEINDKKEVTKVFYILRKEFGNALGRKIVNELVSGTKNEIFIINDILIKKGIKSTEIKKAFK